MTEQEFLDVAHTPPPRTDQATRDLAKHIGRAASVVQWVLLAMNAVAIALGVVYGTEGADRLPMGLGLVMSCGLLVWVPLGLFFAYGRRSARALARHGILHAVPITNMIHGRDRWWKTTWLAFEIDDSDVQYSGAVSVLGHIEHPNAIYVLAAPATGLRFFSRVPRHANRTGLLSPKPSTAKLPR